ncbi:MAG: hypothetical protein HY912_14730 [Desulfomonile tiedjei]|uniref:Uncharacterized protein n=1 Tax=Desulfomonile tiedjei TaxID=2358 RepID=A0A9D6V4U4_9BACT|nr:hypothetical protein [Desulfomonile tiedjei]
MLELAKDRGIFYSPRDSRETLANNLSLLPQDYHDLNLILDQREHSGRAEKLTSIVLNTQLSIDEIKEVSDDYREQAPGDEKVITHQDGTNKYLVTVQYSEIDYSKNRLVQRRPKQAGIEFIIEGDKTIVRMPANAKAKEIVHNLKERLDGKKKTDIPADLIELTEFTNSEQRTEFFTSLISKLPDFKLDDVTSVKVESNIKEVDENELDLEDDQDAEQAGQEMLALVKNVAFKGQSLLASTEYQQLRAKGFFITSIIWRSKQTISPYFIVEYEAGFEEPDAGRGFKYIVRGAFHFQNREYTKTLRPISPEHKQQLLSLIEQTAHRTLAEIRNKVEEVAADHTD